MPTIIVLCGVSHAGKSTYAREVLQKERSPKYNIISSDKIRLKLTKTLKPQSQFEPLVWGKFEDQKQAGIRLHLNMILDACFLSAVARRHSLDGVPHHLYTKELHILLPRREEVLRRAKESGRVPISIVEDMINRFRIPTELELMDFDYVKKIEG